jgi:nucleotide-binding universal stress UspA family protein
MLFVVAFDRSEGALAALRAAERLATAAGATLTAVEVLDPRAAATDVLAPTRGEAMASVAADALERLKGALAAAEITAEAVIEQVRRGDDVPTTLARVAEERGADVLAISSRRAVGVAGLVLGSVTQHVLRVARCPVLVVRP